MKRLELPELPIGPRARKGLKIAGYVLLGLVTFVYALHLTFPYDRVKDRAVDWLSTKYDVSVGGVERGWLPGDFSLRLVQLRTRPEKPGEQPKVIVIDRLAIDIGILSALTGAVDVDIEAQVGPGRIEGTITIGKRAVKARIASRNLPLSDVPGLASVIGMPMDGAGNVKLDLDLPQNDWRKASARLAIDCPRCTVGGEGAFFRPRTQSSANDSFLGQGVPVPLLHIDNLQATWVVDKGKIRTDRFVLQSPHLHVELEFDAAVERRIQDSRIEAACLRYRGTEELKKLDVDFYNALELTGGPLGADDLRHLKLAGTLGSFRAFGVACGGVAVDDGAGGGGLRGRARPDLSNVPADGASGGGARIEPEPPPRAIQPTPKIDDVQISPPATDPGAAGKGAGEGTVAPYRPAGSAGGGDADRDGAGAPPAPPATTEPPPPDNAASVKIDRDGTNGGGGANGAHHDVELEQE